MNEEIKLLEQHEELLNEQMAVLKKQQQFVKEQRERFYQLEAEKAPEPWRPPEGGCLNVLNQWIEEPYHVLGNSMTQYNIQRGLTYENEVEAREWQKLIDWTTRYFALARWCNAKHESDGRFYAAYCKNRWDYTARSKLFDLRCVLTSKAAAKEAQRIMNADPEYWKLPEIGGER